MLLPVGDEIEEKEGRNDVITRIGIDCTVLMYHSMYDNNGRMKMRSVPTRPNYRYIARDDQNDCEDINIFLSAPRVRTVSTRKIRHPEPGTRRMIVLSVRLQRRLL